jgi:hypothetical protein
MAEESVPKNIPIAAQKALAGNAGNGQSPAMSRTPSGGASEGIMRLASMDGKSSSGRATPQRRGSGTMVTPSGIQVVYHTRTQVSN